jgi:hypothetical protein
MRPGAPYDIRLDSKLPSFPVASHPLQLTGFVDAAHANDPRTRRSTTGIAFLLCGGAVAYRSKTQTVTATSSNEAELLAAITAAKTAKYLRAVLFGLGFTQSSPTPIYIDNIVLPSKLSMPAVLPNAPDILTYRHLRAGFYTLAIAVGLWDIIPLDFLSAFLS